MKKLFFIATMLFAVLTLASCEGVDGPDPPPVYADMTIHLEYSGLDDFKGELARIAIFITDENGNFVVRHQADKIDGNNPFMVDCRPGKYVVSAEYVNSNTDEDNIILENVNVELKAYQSLEVVLKIDLHKIERQN
mgnify:CR=1 FL=1